MPIWFFQGMEKMQNLVYANLVSRIVGLALVVILVQNKEDYIWTLPLLGIGTILGAIVSHMVLLPRFGVVKPLSKSQLEVRKQLKVGYPFFVRSLALSIYSNLPVFFLNFIAPAQIVGQFGVADRIVAMLKAVLSAFGHAIFPQMVVLKPEGNQRLVDYLNKYFKPYIAGVIALCALIFIFADPILHLYTGAPSPEIVPILRAMAFLPVSIALAQPMDALMQVYGKEKLISRLLLSAGGLNFLLNLYLIPHQLAFGAALSLFITETAVVFIFLWFFERKYREEAYFLAKS